MPVPPTSMSAQPKTNAQADSDAADGEQLLRIEQVASLTGLTKRTLRYYEEIGLLEPPTRTEGGYRLYTPADVQRLQRIKALKNLLGVELKDVREYVHAEEEREHVRNAYRRESDPQARLKQLDDAEILVRKQLGLVEEKMAGLAEMRDRLNARLAHFDELREELRQQTTAHE